MLTEKDLLTEGIHFQKETKNCEMALPPSISSSNKKQKKKLFSSALFRESLHSNRFGLILVSLGNALIMVAIITILSTLHINATADALKDLFENADYENSIKSSTISVYSSYKSSADAYEMYLQGDDSAKTLFETEVSTINDTTLNTTINNAKILYDATYRLTSGGEENKKSVAKNATIEIVDKTLDATSYSEQEKALLKNIVSEYFDTYGNDRSQSTKQILRKVVPSCFASSVNETYRLKDKEAKDVTSLFEDCAKYVIDEGKSIDNVKTESSLKLMPYLANEDQKDFVTDLSSSLLKLYEKDSDSYLNDSTIRENEIASNVKDYVMDTLSSFAYYEYLPTFTVEYKTNDLGYPIRMVGTGRYADNGNEIMEELSIKSYNPSLYIKESEKMGKKANLLQKMHKDLLTGEDYSQEEVKQAKDEAQDDLKTIREGLDTFFDDFLKREDDQNEYYKEKTIQYEAIAKRATNEVSVIAEKTLIDSYNDKHDVKISTLEEITSENSSMSGKEMMDLVKGYATSSISSYDSYYSEYEKAGYSLIDTNLLSLNKSSQGVMSLLPNSVDESLKEMGQMNTYGIIVGVVAFQMAALLVPMVYTILLSKSLVSEKVETGSLAFTLSTPTNRSCFIFTQAVYLIFSEIVMAATLLAFSLLTRQIGILAGSTDIATSLPVTDICLYALGNFLVSLAISGINFLASCHFNKTSQAIGTGGGLTIFFFICSILGLFATKAIPGTIRITSMSLFNYMTIDSLFDPMAVMAQDYSTFFFKLSFLLIITIVTYILGSINFQKKDLPL